MKKILTTLAVLMAVGVSLAACQNDTSPDSSLVISDPSSRTDSNRIVLYQNQQQSKELPIQSQAQFDAIEETVTKALQHAGQTSPEWISSVVTEDFLEQSFESGTVLKMMFAETRDFTIGSEHRVCDELLIVESRNMIIFGKDGQYQSGPLSISGGDIQEIFTQIQSIE